MYETVTLTGTYLLPDATPAAGTIEIIPSERQIVDSVGNVILSGRVKVTLDGTGSFSVELPATDDVTLNPTGFGYTVAAKLHHAHLPAVSFSLPAAEPEVDIADVTTVDPSTFEPDANYISAAALAALQVEVDLAETGIDTLETLTASGRLSEASLSATYAPVTNPRKFGAVVDGVTDDTVAVQAALQAIYNAGGGTLLIDGHCRVDGQLLIPHDNAIQFPQGRSLRITGLDSGSTAQNDAGITKSLLDLRYSGANAKIVALGQGQLEIDHITLGDNGNSSTPFLLTTQATLHAHNMTVRGNLTKTGTACDQDAFVLGGTTATYDNTVASGFAGYGAAITHCRFDHIRRAVYMRVWVNGVTVSRNWINAACGSNLGTSGAPFEIDTGAVGFARGNLFEQNTIQLGNGVANRYHFGIITKGTGVDHNKFILNDTWDFVGGIGGDLSLSSGGNYVILGLGTNTVVETTVGSNRIINMGTAQMSGGWKFENPASASTVPIMVRRAATQLVNMFEVQDASGNVQWRFGPNGGLKTDANLAGDVPLWIANDTFSVPTTIIRSAKGYGVNLADAPNQTHLNLTGGTGTSQAFIKAGANTPEGAFTAPVGSLYLRTNGGAGTTLYVKETGAGNTGWVAK